MYHDAEGGKVHAAGRVSYSISQEASIILFVIAAARFYNENCMTARTRSGNFVISLLVFSMLLIFSASSCFGSELEVIRKMQRAKGHRWIAGETTISRLPSHERKLRCGLIRPTASVGYQITSLGTSTAPATIDWRSWQGQNFVTPVKDQGNCGSCWAFATVGALESYILIKDNQPGVDENRAEEILLSCSKAGGCDGGYPGRASEYIRSTGLPPESYFVYTATSSDDSCSGAGTGWQINNYKIAAWSYVTTTSVSITAIKNALAHGPLVTSMDVYDDFFSYRTGIYEYATGSLSGGHAVLIVGYVDDPLVNGGGYFIVKNSWGTGWGEGGYFNIAYSQTGSPVGFGEYTIAYRNGVSSGLSSPPSPSNLAATPISTSSINLTWSDNAQDEAGFKIEMCAGSGCANFAQIATVGSNVTTYTSSGLQGDTPYTFRVRAYNAGGDSAYCSDASATTFAPPAVPSAAANLSGIAVSRTQIDLFWTDTSGNENGFRVERCTGVRCSNFKRIASVGANTVQYSNAGLRKGTAYRYRLRAYNSDGNSGCSNITIVNTYR